jgi:alpha-L-fucosidase 2
MKGFNLVIFLLFIFFNSCRSDVDPGEYLRLWYGKPAENWMTEALPIGNGYMGVIFFGGYEHEQLQFSEESLWAGGPGSHPGYNFGLREGASEWLPEIRRLLAVGKSEEAHLLANEKLTGIINPVSGLSFGDYGSQQTMGDLHISILNQSPDISGYYRELDISSSVGRVSYNSGGVNHTRTFLGCYPYKVMAYNFENDAPGGADYSVRITTPHNTDYLIYEDGILRKGGHVNDNQLGFETAVMIKTDGKISFENDELFVKGAGNILLFQTASTAYEPSFPHYRGNDYVSVNRMTMDQIGNFSFNELMEIHVNDYRSLFDRVTFNLEGESFDSLPTDTRLARYAAGNGDRKLEELYFQYGRYLMISSSRPGTMPMHLQGKWNNSTNPPWAADYHTNINLQMLYWPAEQTSLAECHEPLIDYIGTLIPPGRKSAETFFNARGWIVNTMNNAWGYTSPGWEFPWGFFPAGAAWLCRHVWEHFAFNADTVYLQNRAYPLMREAALFWVDYLTEDENGYLVSSPSYSPEHGGISTGASMDHQIAWDLFNNCVRALDILGTNVSERDMFAEYRDRILPPATGRWGQLQEWKEDVDDPENQHRHVSHLYALHPGNQISVEGTPLLAEAAKVSLEARGDGGTGWSLAWKINFWARLHDGNRAHSLLRRLLRPVNTQDVEMSGGGGSYNNLLCAHPPFQLDGNMGGTAGIAEMLLQSHDGIIHILPALPDVWRSGKVSGLKARGNLTVDIEWNDGSLTEFTISGQPGSEIRVIANGRKSDHIIPANGKFGFSTDD